MRTTAGSGCDKGLMDGGGGTGGLACGQMRSAAVIAGGFDVCSPLATSIHPSLSSQ